jgi:hypothetical protein
MFVALIVYVGWQNYKSKLRDLECKRKFEAAAEKWKRAS